MAKKQSKRSKTAFLDLKFFLGLIFSIYGILLSITGIYYVLNPISGIDSSIDIYWGLFMFIIGVINYYKSDKPSSWNKAFAVSGIEHIEKRLKTTIEEAKEELK
jgi:uncharacterized membrane protein HdeD (DUF308 family)